MTARIVAAGDGTRLHVEDRGRGAPIVFLAAWTLSGEVWREAIAAMTARGFRCVAPDRRGHGRSETPATGYDAEILTSDVAAVFDQLGLEGATIVAHSMGAVEALHYAASAPPGLVSRLLLVAPSTPMVRWAEDNPGGIPAEAIAAQLDVLRDDFEGWLDRNAKPFVTPETSEATLAWFRAMILSVPLPVALACWEMFANNDTRETAKRIRQPTLILHGDRDASAPLERTGAATAALIPGARLKIYEGAPHALPITHAERFLADLAEFAAA